jgi:hypothetical protein
VFVKSEREGFEGRERKKKGGHFLKTCDVLTFFFLEVGTTLIKESIPVSWGDRFFVRLY